MSQAHSSLSPGQQAAPGASTPERSKKRILLVIDESRTRLAVWEKFRQAGVEVDQVSAAHLAMEKLRAVSPDGLFLDLLLPYDEAVKLVKQARREEKFGKRPIYVVAGSAMLAIWNRRGIKAGATKVFEKKRPIDQIVAEIVPDLLSTPETPKAPPIDPLVAETAADSQSTPVDPLVTECVADLEPAPETPKAPPIICENAAVKEETPAPPGHIEKAGVTEGTPAKGKLFNRMKLSFKGFGLGKKKQAAPKSTAPAESPPPAPAPPPIAEPPPATGPAQIAVAGAAPEQSKSKPSPAPRPSGFKTGTTAFVNFSAVAVLTIDRVGKVASTDGACTKMFGWQPAELVGKPLTRLLKESSHKDLEKFVEQHTTGSGNQLASVEVTALRKNGQQFRASMTRLAWSSDTALISKTVNSEAAWTAVFRDLTEMPSSLTQGPRIDDSAEAWNESVSISPPSRPKTAPPTPGWSGALQAHKSLSNAHEELHKEFATLSEEATRQRQALEKTERERNELTTRIQAQEAEINRARAAADREGATRKLLEQKVEELTTAKNEFEKKISEQGRGNKEQLEKTTAEFQKQLGDAKAAAEKAEGAQKHEGARVHALEESLTRLREEHERARNTHANELRAAANAARRAEELERRLRDSAAEIARVKEEFEKQTAEWHRRESQWQSELSATKETALKAEAAWMEEAARNKSFEERLRTLGSNAQPAESEDTQRFSKEVASLKQSRDELNAKLAAEKQAGAERRRRAEQLECLLSESTAEIERMQSEKNNEDVEGQRLESELQEESTRIKALEEKLEAIGREAMQRYQHSDEKVAKLYAARTELGTKLAVERQAVTACQQRAVELNRQLESYTPDLQRAKGDLSRAHRSKQTETELTRLYNSRDELTAKLNAEVQGATDAKARAEALEMQLCENTAEINRITVERATYAEQQTSLKSDLMAQLTAAKTAVEQADAKFKERASQFGQVDQELAGLQQVHKELSGKLNTERQAAAESQRKSEELERQLAQSAAKLERVKAEREKDAQQRASLESQLQAELTRARKAIEEAEASRDQESERSKHLQADHDQLKQKFAKEQQAATEAQRRNKELEIQVRENASDLEKIEAERDKQAHKVESLEAQLRDQLSAAKSTSEQPAGATKEKGADLKRLEREVENLRRERQEVHSKCLAEKQESTKARRRVKELEKQLRDIAGGFTTTKLELDKRAANRLQVESGLQEQLKASLETAERAQAAQKEEALRADLLQHELTEVCQTREDLRAELRAEQQKSLDTVERIEEMESRLRESVAELARVKTAAENHAAERVRLEAAQGTFADSAEGLIKDVGRLRETEAAQAAEITELERRVRDGVGSLARVTADLEKERGERRRVEQRVASLTQQLEERHQALNQHLESERVTQTRINDLEGQLHERERALARVLADLRKEVADRELAEQQLEAVGDMSAQLRQYLSLFEDSKKVFKRTQEQLESKLQAGQKALNESETKWQNEVNQRQRLQEELAKAQRSLDEKTDRISLDVARLQSELQVEQLERKRLEGDAQQNRFASLDSARVARGMVNALRRQLQDAVDNLMQATRRLVEITSDDEPKKLVESVLENALLLQTNLQHGSETGEDSSESRAAA
jgi:PAS domain S-box-containing protein